MRWTKLLAALLVAASVSPSQAQTSVVPEQAAPLYEPSNRYVPMPRTLRLREGETRVTLGVARAGNTIISIPVQHRRTIILREEVRGDNWVIPAGALGYESADVGIDIFIYNFRSSGSAWGRGTVRCFVTNSPGEAMRSRCILGRSPMGEPRHPLAAPYFGITVEYTNEVTDLTVADFPVVEDHPVEFQEDMRVEYALMPWTLSRARLSININGERAAMREQRWDRSGAAEFPTPVGYLRLEKGGNNPQRATASLRPLGPPSETSSLPEILETR
jgi:hypothetical protein